MSTSSIGSATTPAVTTTTATTPPPTTDRQAEAAASTPAAETTTDAFEKATEKAPVALNTAVEEDDWGDCDFDDVKSGGGGIAAVDPNNGRLIRG